MTSLSLFALCRPPPPTAHVLLLLGYLPYTADEKLQQQFVGQVGLTTAAPARLESTKVETATADRLLHPVRAYSIVILTKSCLLFMLALLASLCAWITF
jgi:hypothetical protein